MSTSHQVQYVPLSGIQSGVNPYGPTRIDDVKDILSGLKSTDDILMLPPIHLTTEGAVLAGERRFEAVTKYAELANNFDILVPVIYRSPANDKEAVTIAVNENERRKNATPIELSHAFASAIKAGFTQKEACSLFVKTNGKPQDLAWGSMMTRIYEGTELSSPFRKACLRFELNVREIYEYVVAAYSKSEDLGKVQDLLDATAERIKQKALKAAEASTPPEPTEPIKKMLSSKRIVSFADEATEILKDRVKESLKDGYSGPRIQESDAAAAATVLKYVKLIVGGGLTIEQFLKKFHVEAYKPKPKADPEGSETGTEEGSEEKPTKKSKRKKKVEETQEG